MTSTDDYIAARKTGELDDLGRPPEGDTHEARQEEIRANWRAREERRRAWVPAPPLSCCRCGEVPPWPDRGGVVLQWEPDVSYQCGACRAVDPMPVRQRAPWERP